MSVFGKFSVTSMLATVVLCVMTGQAAAAVELDGYKYEDTMNVGGKNLVLVGAGVRAKSVIKVYSAGLYLQEKVNTVDAIMNVEGPRRVRIVMMREIASDDLGAAFMTALNNNVSADDQARIITQIAKIGEMFGQVGMLKKGDTIDADWIPGSGTQCSLNGKKFGGVIPAQLFYNSILKVWLGDKPVDASLKAAWVAAPTTVAKK